MSPKMGDPQSHRGFTRQTKRYPGLVIMNPDYVMSPRPPPRKPSGISSSHHVTATGATGSEIEVLGSYQTSRRSDIQDMTGQNVETSALAAISLLIPRAPTKKVTTDGHHHKRYSDSIDLKQATAANEDDIRPKIKLAKMDWSSEAGNVRSSPIRGMSVRAGISSRPDSSREQEDMILTGHRPQATAKADLSTAQEGDEKTKRREENRRTPRKALSFDVPKIDKYRNQEVLQGNGFSTTLMKLCASQTNAEYPTPSEALDSSRTNKRLQQAVQTVGAVGLPPPQLEESYFASHNLKRHWLMQHRFKSDQSLSNIDLLETDLIKAARVFYDRSDASTVDEIQIPILSEKPLHRNDVQLIRNDLFLPALFPSSDAVEMYTPAIREPAGSTDEFVDDLKHRTIVTPEESAADGQKEKGQNGSISAQKVEQLPEYKAFGKNSISHSPRGVLIEMSQVGPSERTWTSEQLSTKTQNATVSRISAAAPVSTLPENESGLCLPTVVNGNHEQPGIHLPSVISSTTANDFTQAKHVTNRKTSFSDELISQLSNDSHIEQVFAHTLKDRSTIVDDAIVSEGPHRKVVEGRGHVLGSDRPQLIQALARKQALGQGNRLLARAAEELKNLNIEQAISSFIDAKQIFGRANLLPEKKYHLDELGNKIQTAQQRLKELREELKTPAAPPPPKQSHIKVFLRPPDRARPQGFPQNLQIEANDYSGQSNAQQVAVSGANTLNLNAAKRQSMEVHHALVSNFEENPTPLSNKVEIRDGSGAVMGHVSDQSPSLILIYREESDSHGDLKPSSFPRTSRGDVAAESSIRFDAQPQEIQKLKSEVDGDIGMHLNGVTAATNDFVDIERKDEANVRSQGMTDSLSEDRLKFSTSRPVSSTQTAFDGMVGDPQDNKLKGECLLSSDTSEVGVNAVNSAIPIESHIKTVVENADTQQCTAEEDNTAAKLKPQADFAEGNIKEEEPPIRTAAKKFELVDDQQFESVGRDSKIMEYLSLEEMLLYLKSREGEKDYILKASAIYREWLHASSILQAHAQRTLVRSQFLVFAKSFSSIDLPRCFPLFHFLKVQGLQAYFRGVHLRRRFRCLRAATQSIQANVRRYGARQDFCSNFAGITALQCFCRTFATTPFSAMVSSAKIQEGYTRCQQCRRKWVSLVIGAKQLQKYLKSSIMRRSHAEISSAANFISSIIRRAPIRLEHCADTKASISLQAHSRRQFLQSFFRGQKLATRTLWSVAVQHNARTRWLCKYAGSIILKLSAERFICHQNLRRELPLHWQKEAACHVQSFVRAKLVQCLYIANLDMQKDIERLNGCLEEQQQRQAAQVQLFSRQTKKMKKLKSQLFELNQELLLLRDQSLEVSWLASDTCEKREKMCSLMQDQLFKQEQLLSLESEVYKAFEQEKTKAHVKRSEVSKRKVGQLTPSHSFLSRNTTYLLAQVDDQGLQQALQIENFGQYPEAILMLTDLINDPKCRLLVLLKRAVCFFHMSMRSDALKDLQSAIQEFHQDWRAYFLRALIHAQYGRIADALQDISSTVQRNPYQCSAYVLRCNIAFDENRYTDAVIDMDLAIKIRSDDVTLYLARGKALLKLGNAAAAFQDYERAVRMYLEQLEKAQIGTERKALVRNMRQICTDRILMEMSKCMLETGNSTTFANILTQIISYDNSRAIAYSLRGHARCFQNEFEAAQGDFDRAVGEDHSNSDVYVFRSLFWRNSDSVFAFLDLKHAIELDNDNARAYFVCGKLHEAHKEWHAAIHQYRLALLDDDESNVLEASIRMSEIILQVSGSDMDQRAFAFQTLRKAAIRHAPKAEPLVALARSRAKFGDFKNAIKDVCRAIHLHPNDCSLFALRARLLKEQKHLVEAQRDSLRSLNLLETKDLTVCKETAVLMINLGMNAAARVYLEQQLADYPRNADFERLLGIAMFNLNETKKAFMHLSEAIRIAPTDAHNYGARANFLAQQGNFPKAIADYNSALAYDHTDSAYFYGRALCLNVSGKEEEALRDLNQVISLSPWNINARLLRGSLLEKNGQRAKAFEDYEYAISYVRGEVRLPEGSAQARGQELQDPAKARKKLFMLLVRRALLHARRQNYAAAIEDYNEATELNPLSSITLLQRGIAYHMHGYFPSACTDYGKCLALDPNDESARRNRAQAFIAQKLWRKAADDIEFIPQDKRDSQTWLALADCYRSMQEINKALMAAERALLVASGSRFFGGYLGLSKLLTKCLVVKSDLQEEAFPRSTIALRTLSKAVHLHPSSNFARLKLAFALFGRGNLREAANQLQVVRRADPTNAMAIEFSAILHGEIGNLHLACSKLNALICNESTSEVRAQLLATRGVLHQRLQDTTIAERDLWNSSRIIPESSENHYNIGCLHMQREDWFRAMKSFDRAIELRRSNDLALLNRSVVLFHLGKPERAIEDLSEALKITPDFGQAYLNRAAIKNSLGSIADAEKDLEQAVSILSGTSQGFDARECLCDTRHFINRNKGMSLDTMSEYSALINAEALELIPQSGPPAEISARSLWFDCFTGKITI